MSTESAETTTTPVVTAETTTTPVVTAETTPTPDAIPVVGAKRNAVDIYLESKQEKKRQTTKKESGSKIFKCEEEGCSYECKKSGHLKSHKAMIHDIDVVFHFCGINKCEYRAKQAGDLKRHKSSVHDIDVIWYVCDIASCDYKAKQSGTLKRHKDGTHASVKMWGVYGSGGICVLGVWYELAMDNGLRIFSGVIGGVSCPGVL